MEEEDFNREKENRFFLQKKTINFVLKNNS